MDLKLTLKKENNYYFDILSGLNRSCFKFLKCTLKHNYIIN